MSFYGSGKWKCNVICFFLLDNVLFFCLIALLQKIRKVKTQHIWFLMNSGKLINWKRPGFGTQPTESWKMFPQNNSEDFWVRLNGAKYRKWMPKNGNNIEVKKTLKLWHEDCIFRVYFLASIVVMVQLIFFPFSFRVQIGPTTPVVLLYSSVLVNQDFLGFHENIKQYSGKSFISFFVLIWFFIAE